MGNSTNERIKLRIQELRIAMGGCCANPFCEHPYEKLEFAHTKRTGLNGWGRGRKERYYDVINHPDSYILLCKECHKLFDRGELNLADFNRFICPNWNMFWEVIYVEKFFHNILILSDVPEYTAYLVVDEQVAEITNLGVEN